MGIYNLAMSDLARIFDRIDIADSVPITSHIGRDLRRHRIARRRPASCVPRTGIALASVCRESNRTLQPFGRWWPFQHRPNAQLNCFNPDTSRWKCRRGFCRRPEGVEDLRGVRPFRIIDQRPRGIQ